MRLAVAAYQDQPGIRVISLGLLPGFDQFSSEFGGGNKAKSGRDLTVCRQTQAGFGGCIARQRFGYPQQWQAGPIVSNTLAIELIGQLSTVLAVDDNALGLGQYRQVGRVALDRLRRITVRHLYGGVAM